MTAAFDEAFDFDVFELDVTGATLAASNAPVTVLSVADTPVTLVTTGDVLITAGGTSDVLLTGL